MIFSLALLSVSLVSHASAQLPGLPGQTIECGNVVSGALTAALPVSYTFTATTSGLIKPSTCGLTQADTYIEVSVGGSVVAFSDNVGNVICPGSPQSSALTVHIESGSTYTITVKPGAAWTAASGNTFSMDLHCQERIPAYWETMFQNSGYDWSLFAVMNGIWHYDGVSTCVGYGYYWGVCPFHHIHCAGEITYGWGSSQTIAVLDALAEADGKYPGYSNGCPDDLVCTDTQFTCINRECVDLDKLCDGNDDCGDGSDENPALTQGLCEAPTPSPDDNNNGFCGATGGCTDPLAINFDDTITCNDGSCEFCFNGTGGPSLHLVTDFPSGLNAGRCGIAANGDLELSCHTSMKYPKSIISLLSPLSGDQPFDTEFDDQGRTAVTSPQHWIRAQGPICDNTYDGVFAWSDVLKSDDSTVLIRTDFDSLVMFTGFIAVDMFEQLDPLRGVNLTRWVRQKLPFRITFDTDVLVTSGEVTVQDKWNEFFAIIEQNTIIVDSTANPPSVEADIVLWASVQYPFRLIEKSISVNVAALNNPQLTVSLKEDCSPAASGDDACNQKFLIHVALQDACTFTGRYTVDFDVECVPGVAAADCPLSTGQTAAVAFFIESENVCPQVVDHIVAVASAHSYATARTGFLPYSVDKHSAFTVDSMAYFEIDLDSIDGLIVETTVTMVELCFDIACSNPILLYDNGVTPLPAVQIQVLNYPRAPATSLLPRNSDIHLFLDSSVFVVPLDGSLDFQLRVDVDVEYYNTASLLEAGEERDAQMVSIESLRSSPKGRTIHLNSESESTTIHTRANGQAVSAEGTFGNAISTSEGTNSDDSGSSALVITAFVSAIVVAITVALWH